MKKITYGILLTAAILLLTGCREEENPGPVILGDSSAEQSSETPDSLPKPPTEDDTLPPEEGMLRSLLTNEWVDEEVAQARPIAVMIPNEANALPQYNISEASILYEANVEGRMTRLMGIFEDWTDLDKIGNVRSLRSYYAYWAFEYDAFIVHCGQPFFADSLFEDSNTTTINESMASDAAAFYRDETRQAPHNAYTTGAGILEVINRRSLPLVYRGLSEQNHFRFATKASPNTLAQYKDKAENATYIDMSGCYPLTRCYFEYNAQDGLYYRSQHLSSSTDGPHIDGATGEQLTFKNIVVQYIHYEDLGGGYLAAETHDTTRDGWFFTDGKGIHVNWKKTEDYGPTRFYDDYGNEIIFNTGKTMICIVDEEDNFTFK